MAIRQASSIFKSFAESFLQDWVSRDYIEDVPDLPEMISELAVLLESNHAAEAKRNCIGTGFATSQWNPASRRVRCKYCWHSFGLEITVSPSHYPEWPV